MRLNALLILLGMLAHCSSHKPGVTRGDELASLFSRASKVEVLSYTNRMYRAPLTEGEEKPPVPIDTVFFVVGDLRIPESTIKEEIILNSEQRDSLFRLLKNRQCKIDEVGICYNPRHALIFYDSNNRPFSYIELCFDCTNYQTSGNFELDFCIEKSEALKNVFQSFGIEYFGAGNL